MYILSRLFNERPRILLKEKCVVFFIAPRTMEIAAITKYILIILYNLNKCLCLTGRLIRQKHSFGFGEEAFLILKFLGSGTQQQ